MSHDSPVLQTLPSALHISFPLCSVTLYPLPFIWLTPVLPPALSQTQRALLEALCPSVVEAVEVGALLKSLCWSESQWPSTRLAVGVEMGEAGKNPPDCNSPLDLNRTEAERRSGSFLLGGWVSQGWVPRTGVV